MNTTTKLKSLAIGILLPTIAFSQEDVPVVTTSAFANPLFLTMFVIAVVLAIVIVAFSYVFKNVAQSDYLTSKLKKEKENNNSSASKTALTIALFFLLPLLTMAQDEVASMEKVSNGTVGGLDNFTFYFMVVIVFFELLILGLMFYQFNYLVKTQTTPETTIDGNTTKQESKLVAALTDAVPIEEEESIMLDHEYDGIRELDNNLPPWWKYGFYLTIVFAVVYLISFHVIKTGELQAVEFKNEVAEGKLAVDEFMKKSANNVDENTVKLLTDASDLAKGQDVYKASCAACHGQLGEGGVGPNMTDEFWLHGGSIQDIFKSVKYGWVEKGMKSWKTELSPMQIAQVGSYIKSLKGTNPPNGKAPQGVAFIEGVASAATDSLATKVDSLSVAIKADSLNTAKK